MSGNTQNWGAPKVELTHGLLSCCEWTGVPLGTVLAEAGVKLEAKWMLAEGADAARDASRSKRRSMTPCSPIRRMASGARGYPLRLLLPGYEGNTNVKWLRRLKLGAEPFQTREETSNTAC